MAQQEHHFLFYMRLHNCRIRYTSVCQSPLHTMEDSYLPVRQHESNIVRILARNIQQWLQQVKLHFSGIFSWNFLLFHFPWLMWIVTFNTILTNIMFSEIDLSYCAFESARIKRMTFSAEFPAAGRPVYICYLAADHMLFTRTVTRFTMDIYMNIL